MRMRVVKIQFNPEYWIIETQRYWWQSFSYSHTPVQYRKHYYNQTRPMDIAKRITQGERPGIDRDIMWESKEPNSWIFCQVLSFILMVGVAVLLVIGIVMHFMGINIHQTFGI